MRDPKLKGATGVAIFCDECSHGELINRDAFAGRSYFALVQALSRGMKQHRAEKHDA